MMRLIDINVFKLRSIFVQQDQHVANVIISQDCCCYLALVERMTGALIVAAAAASADDRQRHMKALGSQI